MKNASVKIASRNPYASALAHGSNRPQAVRARKGKGSFSRNEKHRSRDY